MGLVHTLVAEVLCELVYAGETAHDEPLEVKLVGNSHVKGNVKSVMVCDERTCGCAAGDGLKDRGLYLKAAGCVKVLAHGGNNLGPLYEYILYLRIYDKVYIPLTVAELRIGEGVVYLAIGLLYDRKHFEGLAKYGKFFCVNRQLAGLGNEGEAFYTYDVADVKEFLEYGVIHCFVLSGANFVTLYIYLDAA